MKFNTNPHTTEDFKEVFQQEVLQISTETLQAVIWISSFNFHTSQKKDISNVMELYKVTPNGSTMLKVILFIDDDMRFWWLFEKKHELIRFHLIPKVVGSSQYMADKQCL